MAAQFALNPQLLKSVPLFSAFTDAQLGQVPSEHYEALLGFASGSLAVV